MDGFHGGYIGISSIFKFKFAVNIILSVHDDLAQDHALETFMPEDLLALN